MALPVFIARRVAAALVLLLFVSFIVFLLVYLAPGSPEAILLGHRPRDPEVIREIRRTYHLDEPFLAQYWHWLWDALHFDFGRSISTSQTVTSTIDARASVTVFLGVYAFLGTMVLGVLAGLWSGIKSESAAGRAIGSLAYLAMCAPSFAVAIFLLYLFAVELGWFPAFGPGEGFTDRLWHLTLPAVAIIMGGAAYVIMYTRTAVADALKQDYVAFAHARGLSRRRVLFAHALRNALIPIVTTGGATLAYLLVGAVIVETAFALPGLGTLLLESVRREDIPVVQALSLLIAATVIGANLLTDIIYTLVDPRIRFGKAAL